jgi:hypothetical protein
MDRINHVCETPWHGSSLEFFFGEVGGIVFEVLRVAGTA